jgi:serine/threonine protein kinase
MEKHRGVIIMGKYQEIEVIGKGGMAVVVKAIQTSLNRLVAIKQISARYLKEVSAIKRFEQEARIVARLDHPNIVHIYDYFKEGENYFIVMEFIDGQSLAKYLCSKEIFPMEMGILVLTQILHALQYAHRQGIIHRDIKPSNILISHQGSVKLTDFGISRLVTEASSLTTENAIIGTPGYMSPEQFQSQKLHPRSDLFSIGVVLYEIVTGQRPFPGKNLAELALQITRGKYPPPEELNPTLSPKLAKIITKCLETSPEKRYQEAAELLEELTNWLERRGLRNAPREIETFVTQPEEYTRTLSERTVKFQLERGKMFLAQHRFEAAIQEAEDILLHSPEHSEALALIKKARLEKQARGEEKTATLPQPKIFLPKLRLFLRVITLTILLLFVGRIVAFFRGAWSKKEIIPSEAPKEINRASSLPKKIIENLKASPGKSNKLAKSTSVLPKPTTPATRAEKKKKPGREEKEVKFSYLKILTSPWSKVYLNGKYLATAPMVEAKKIKPGKYTLKFVNEKCFPKEETVDLKPGESVKLRIELKFLPGYLTVNAPPETEIRINENFYGKTPLETLIELERGEYRVTLFHPQFGEDCQRVKIRPKKIEVIKPPWHLKNEN